MPATPVCRSYEYRPARAIADTLAADLAGACERIEIAGSLRRQKPVVNDIELVAIPRCRPEEREHQVGLFTPPPEPPLVSCLWERLNAAPREVIQPIKPGSREVEPDLRWQEKRLAGSRYFRLYLPEHEIKVDLFMTDPQRWGLIFTIRTGSALFSEALVTRWTRISRGGHSKDGLLHDRERVVVPTPEEPDVFYACRACWIDPPFRKGEESIRPVPGP